jgi:hypothetical protein
MLPFETATGWELYSSYLDAACFAAALHTCCISQQTEILCVIEPRFQNIFFSFSSFFFFFKKHKLDHARIYLSIYQRHGSNLFEKNKIKMAAACIHVWYLSFCLLFMLDAYATAFLE